MPEAVRKTYHELIRLPTFQERYEYLRIGGRVGEDTFGWSRYLNQALYTSEEWRKFRRDIIIRDGGYDLALPGRPIPCGIIVHHINPLTKDDLELRNDCIFDPDNVVCVSGSTHRAIHYGDGCQPCSVPIVRQQWDTCPWKGSA